MIPSLLLLAILKWYIVPKSDGKIWLNRKSNNYFLASNTFLSLYRTHFFHYHMKLWKISNEILEKSNNYFLSNTFFSLSHKINVKYRIKCLNNQTTIFFIEHIFLLSHRIIENIEWNIFYIKHIFKLVIEFCYQRTAIPNAVQHCQWGRNSVI